MGGGSGGGRENGVDGDWGILLRGTETPQEGEGESNFSEQGTNEKKRDNI